MDKLVKGCGLGVNFRQGGVARDSAKRPRVQYKVKFGKVYFDFSRPFVGSIQLTKQIVDMVLCRLLHHISLVEWVENTLDRTYSEPRNIS